MLRQALKNISYLCEALKAVLTLAIMAKFGDDYCVETEAIIVTSPC